MSARPSLRDEMPEKLPTQPRMILSYLDLLSSKPSCLNQAKIH